MTPVDCDTQADAQASAGQPTRVQVLDVGDRVSALFSWGEQEGVIVRAWTKQSNGVVYDWSADNAVRSLHVGQPRRSLTRVGGDLQVGDWVRVDGDCETLRTPDVEHIHGEVGIIVDTIAGGVKGDFVVYVPCLLDAYECDISQLTRITRAEALA